MPCMDMKSKGNFSITEFIIKQSQFLFLLFIISGFKIPCGRFPDPFSGFVFNTEICSW
jgi:hypothetical protein